MCVYIYICMYIYIQHTHAEPCDGHPSGLPFCRLTPSELNALLGSAHPAGPLEPFDPQSKVNF